MKAIGYKQNLPIEDEMSLQDIELDRPEAQGRDLLVEIKAVSVNPADTKVRQGMPSENGEWKVLGWDAAGIVAAVGSGADKFNVGDDVYYSGSMARPGTNSEYHLVDERIVGRKPTRLSYAEAAALPLTTLTAWEMLFDRLAVNRPTAQGGDLMLVIGGAGGVGSITIQLLRELTEMTIIATASRPETQAWVRELGAHHVINHREPLTPQIEALDIGAPGFVFCTNQTAKHFPDIVQLIAPQGRIGLIEGADELNPGLLVQKALSLHCELMFTRSLFNTPDMAEQGELLNEVSALVDAGRIHSTATEVAGKIDAATLRAVHAQIETGSARGKIVLEGF